MYTRIQLLFNIILISFICYSCEDIINEENLENDHLILVAPTDGITLTSGTIQFDWQELKGASSYRIQIARPNFISPEQIVWDEIVQDSTGTNTAVLLQEGDYEWRVRGENSAYVTPYTSATLVIN